VPPVVFDCALFEGIETVSASVFGFGSDPSSFSVVAVAEAPPKAKKGGRKEPGREA